MGARGPVGKRSDQRLGHQTKADLAAVTSAPAADVVDAPAADPEWHPVARMWFESLAKSGQSRFYEPSDWSFAYLMAESMSRDLKPQFVGFKSISQGVTEAEYAVIPLKGASIGAYVKAASALMATEGDRRRLNLELKRGAGVDDSNVERLDDWRADYG